MRNLLLAGLSIFAFTGRVISEDGWKRGLEKNGIMIETRSIPGSAYKEFKARMVVKAKLSKAISIMEDIPGYTGWMKDCKEARVLSKASATSGVIYSLQATPWPIAEREAVVGYSFSRSKNPPALRIQIEAAPNAVPVTPGRVRISRLKGHWTFVEVAPGSVEVTYMLHSEPGGSLPAWAIAGMVAHLPYETLSKLRARLEN
ncbi:MAG: START domain-containing protein [Turneriella sp.]